MIDLFGHPITDLDIPRPSHEKKKRDESARGYSAPPGTGPVDHFCKDCRHFVKKNMAKTYFKCWLMNRVWTGGPKTDIRANSPACRNWTSKVQIDPDGTYRTAVRCFTPPH